jgi:predicted Zn-dependent peptidase
VKIDDVRRFYHGMFRPDRVTLVIGGQITRPEVEALIAKDLGDWKAEGDALSATPPTPPVAATTRPKLIVVDRPGAVQSVISVVRDGLPVTAPERPLVDLINTALGGSFTSRLNENLREKHGWTYGAGSAFTSSRGQGMFTVRTAVEADFTGPSALEIKKGLAAMSKDGLTADELTKVKAQDRADLVELYETLGSATGRLATFNALGLPVDHDATATAERQKATLEELLALAKGHVDPSTCTFVIVGDAKKVMPQLEQAGFEKPVAYTVEGLPE